MPRLAANLNRLFTEVPLLDRFAAAAAAGFKGVEITFPYTHEPGVLAEKASEAGVKVTLINAPPGDWAAGERGLAAIAGRETDFRESLEVAAKWATRLGCPNVHVMAGVVAEDDIEEAFETYVGSMTYAAAELGKDDLRCCIEAINPGDMPGYFLTRPDDALTILDEVDDKNLWLLYDIYHAQITQGGIADFLEGNLSRISHVQVASVPGRHEPDQLSELNFRYLFDLLEAHGYAGWVGCEYSPRVGTLPGLRWAKDWLKG